MPRPEPPRQDPYRAPGLSQPFDELPVPSPHSQGAAMSTTKDDPTKDPNFQEYPKLLFNQETGQEITVQSKADEESYGAAYGPTPPAPKSAEKASAASHPPSHLHEEHESASKKK